MTLVVLECPLISGPAIVAGFLQRTALNQTCPSVRRARAADPSGVMGAGQRRKAPPTACALSSLAPTQELGPWPSDRAGARTAPTVAQGIEPEDQQSPGARAPGDCPVTWAAYAAEAPVAAAVQDSSPAPGVADLEFPASSAAAAVREWFQGAGDLASLSFLTSLS